VNVMAHRRSVRVVAITALLALVLTILAAGLTQRASASGLAVSLGSATAVNSRCTSQTVTVTPRLAGTSPVSYGKVTDVVLTGVDRTACPAAADVQVRLRYGNLQQATTTAPVTVASTANPVAMKLPNGVPDVATIPHDAGWFLLGATVYIGGFAVPTVLAGDSTIAHGDAKTQCLSVSAATDGAGGRYVQRAPCSSADAQRWAWDGTRLMAAGLCLSFNSTAAWTEGTADVVLVPCAAGDEKQTWYRDALGHYVNERPAVGGYPVPACLDFHVDPYADVYNCGNFASQRFTIPKTASSQAACTSSALRASVPTATSPSWTKVDGFTTADRTACNGKSLDVVVFNGNQNKIARSVLGEAKVDDRGDPNVNAAQIARLGQTPTSFPGTVYAWIVVDGWIIGPSEMNAARADSHWSGPASSTTGVVKRLANGGLCLRSVGSALGYATCTGAASQQFTYDGFRLTQGGLCVSALGGAVPAEGSAMTLSACAGLTDPRQILLRDATNDTVYVVGVRGQSGGVGRPMCLDSPSATDVHVWSCNYNDNQRWSRPQTYVAPPSITGYVWNPTKWYGTPSTGCLGTNGTSVALRECSGLDTTQQWTYTDTWKQLKSSSGQCVQRDSTSGTALSLVTCDPDQPLQAFTYSDADKDFRAASSTLCLGTTGWSLNEVVVLRTCDATEQNANWTRPSPTYGAAAGPNLALYRPTAASGHQTPWVPSYVVDNDVTGTYWESGVTTGPKWVQVDLGASVPISRVTLRLPPLPAWEPRTQSLEVQASHDGVSWTPIVRRADRLFSPSTGNSVSFTFSPVTYRYVRVDITNNTSNYGGQLSDLGVYGS
jgi:hypothetical protein